MLKLGFRPVLVFILVLTISASSVTFVGAQEAEEQRLRDARQQLETLEGQIDRAEGDAAQADDALAEAEATLRELEAIVNDVATQVEEQRVAVADAQRRYRLVQARAEELHELFGDRIARMYKHGADLAFEVMLTAPSAEDAMARTSLLARVAESDQVELEHLDAAQVAVDAERRRLEAEEQQLETMLEEQRDLLDHADRLRDRRALAAVDARSELDGLHAQRDELEAEESELQDTIRRLQEEERRRQEEAKRAASAADQGGSGGASASATVSSSGHRWPVCGPVTSEFGPRWGRQHRGIDQGVPTGTPIAASKAGTVISAGWQGGYGNLLLVDHHDGVVTAYAHLSSFQVGVGASVAQGETVALSGNTGNSTGPHLHFEVRVNGTAVNPRQYLAGSPC